MIKLAVSGAGGRMGRRIVALASESKQFKVVAALERADHPDLGQDAGVWAGIGTLGIALGAAPTETPEVMIDFSLPEATAGIVSYCTERKVALVLGTTGLADDQVQMLREASQKIAIVYGANMSLGVNLLFQLAAEVAGKLDDAYDVEVVETHHRFKRDAPSGTALQLARQMAQAKGWPFPDCLVHGREGRETTRAPQTIGMHAVRAGDTVGEHAVIFAALGETVELRHSAHTRDTFVQGALHAARWIVARPAGMYGIKDVWGL